MKKVRAALTAAKLLAHNFSGHSFRRGAATTAAMVGIKHLIIQYSLNVQFDRHVVIYISVRVVCCCFFSSPALIYHIVQ